MDPLEISRSNFDRWSIADRFLSSFDHKNLQWVKTVESKELRKFLNEYLCCSQKLYDLLVEIPQNLRFGALEMILRNDEASIEQLNNLTSFLAILPEFVDGRIAEVAFLIRSDFLQAMSTNKQLTALELFPFHPSYSFHTALFVAKGFVESGRMQLSELLKIQEEFEIYCDDRERRGEG